MQLIKWSKCEHLLSITFYLLSRTEQNRTEVYLKIPKGIRPNATRIYKHNISQCTNMAVDGVVIKCSRICNKHKYFVSVVEKVNFFFILHRRHVVGAQTVPSQRDVSFDH